jgi:small subunit ribosomal protein S20
MANHASAEKRNRQRLKKTARNRAAKSTLRTTVKKARVAIVGGTEGAVALQTAASALDRAASKGVIPAKRAARTQARLAAALHKAAVAAKA